MDRGQSLSAFVADALRAHLQAPAHNAHAARTSEVSPRPIMFVRDMRAALAFCRALGLRLGARSRNGRWAARHRPRRRFASRIVVTNVRSVDSSASK
ncbi:MAG: hypothetical protein M3Y48_05845 [Actinomycetota bacterium]|nr:hypothetical protein [Actinomycetota bacterium]